MKTKKLLLMILCGILSAAVLTSCIKKEKETEIESKEAPKDGEGEEEIKPINLKNYTTLQVLTDNTQFTPAAQDQSYHPETDMNPGCIPERRITDTGSVVYMSQAKSGLFAFQKADGSAGLACSKPDCGHDIKTVGGNCQANLRVLDAEIGGIQYYNGNFYYTLADGASVLYKTSSDHEIKSQYLMLLGEKGSGICGGWLIHRGYIYFYVENDGLYKVSADNPSDKELIIDMSKKKVSINWLIAEGSYVYFRIREDNTFAVARYNTESYQIEQFLGLEKSHRTPILHNGKLYYIGYLESERGAVYQYDTASGRKEIFLQGEDKKDVATSFELLAGDSDYIYIRKNVYGTKDFYNDQEMIDDILYLAYTWDGTEAGEILNTDNFDERSWEAFEIFSKTESELTGSDSDRIYYLSRQWDEQVQENGVLTKVVEGSEKTVISYINKSEISAEAAAPVYIAGEIYD